jgi:TPR repeat protein
MKPTGLMLCSMLLWLSLNAVTAVAATPAQNEVENLIKLAEQGDSGAQYHLGVMYYNGEGVEQDVEQAIALFLKSAEKGDARGQNSIGVMYASGQFGSADDQQAAAWYLKAAE